MSNNDKAVIYFGDIGFVNVTNETVAGKVYTREEAKAWGERREVITTNP